LRKDKVKTLLLRIFGKGFGFASLTLLLEHPTNKAEATAIAKGILAYSALRLIHFSI
jgi:hypothetical protein